MNTLNKAITPFESSVDRLTVNVFVVSASGDLRKELSEKLSSPRWKVFQAGSGAGALELLRTYGDEEAILLLDPMLPDLEPNEFNAMVRGRYRNTQILMLNTHTGQLLQGSAAPTEVTTVLTDAINRSGAIGGGSFQPRIPEPQSWTSETKPLTEGRSHTQTMIGESASMQRTYSVIGMVAPRDTTVLVTGESGTGKDLVAQEIHAMSPRRKQPMIVVNCAAIPETMLEAELFGYTKGAFTGAVQSRIGRIHAAHGGTLFLDEIGDMPLSLQSKILRFLEQGEVQRLGGNDNLRVNVRVIAATNSHLKKLVGEQRFREDLYYRLAVFPIHLPPLRDRLSDLQALSVAFIAKFRPGASLSREALQILEQHSWPGNIRELRNAIERATILMGTGLEIRPEHIVL